MPGARPPRVKADRFLIIAPIFGARETDMIRGINEIATNGTYIEILISDYVPSITGHTELLRVIEVIRLITAKSILVLCRNTIRLFATSNFV